MRTRLGGAILGTVVFTILMPGSIVVWIPRMMTGRWPFTGSSTGPGSAAATVLAVAGASLYIWCAADFVRRGRGTPAPIAAPEHLVLIGPYSVVRNPMYVSVLAILLAEIISHPSAIMAWYTAVVAVGFEVFILAYEQPTLSRRFGAEYESYRRSVAAWIPSVW